MDFSSCHAVWRSYIFSAPVLAAASCGLDQFIGSYKRICAGAIAVLNRTDNSSNTTDPLLNINLHQTRLRLRRPITEAKLNTK